MPISHKHQFLKYPDYISPLPADELIKLGSIKQTLYDQGVEKIESRVKELDQYGLSLLKEQDKKYFSQEMDKFMKAVNESSAKTDFSHMANVKNILSIGRPLENDPYILNAIQSSAEVRRRQKVLSSLKSDERSAANDYDFMKEAYDYLEDPNVGSKIGASGKSYTPYRDLSKKFADVVAKVKPTVSAKPTFTKDGRWIIQQTTEGVDAARLEEMFEATLDESDRNQLRIDTNYDIKVRGKDVIAQDYVQYNTRAALDTRESIEANKAWIDQITPILQKYPDAATAQKVEETQKLIQQLEIRQKIYVDNAAKSLDQITDSDLVNFHKKGFVSNLANAYAYRQEKQEIDENPYALEEVRYSRQVALENLRDYHENQRAERNFYLDRIKDKELVDTGGEFGQVFAPMPGLEKEGQLGSYLTRVNNATGYKNLYIGDWRNEESKKKLINDWEKAYNQYNGGKNALDKLKGLQKLMTFSYDPDLVLGKEGEKIKNKEAFIRKEKEKSSEVVNNLIKFYENVQKNLTTAGAVVSVQLPNGQLTELAPSAFLNMGLQELTGGVNPLLNLYKTDEKGNKKDIWTLDFLSGQYHKKQKDRKGYIEPPGGFQQYIEENYPGANLK